MLNNSNKIKRTLRAVRQSKAGNIIRSAIIAVRQFLRAVRQPLPPAERCKVKTAYALGLKKDPANLSIVIKYASRSRPEFFKMRLSQWIDMLSFRHKVRFVCSFDDDDESMKTESVMAFLDEERKRVPIDVYYNPQPQTKISAMNANLESCRMDMLIVCQDDMEILVKGYDHLLAQYLFYYFPDGDGVINVRLGHSRKRWKRYVAAPVFGWKHYRRFNYIFNPVYRYQVADVELRLVAEKLEKLAHLNDKKIIKHDWLSINDELRQHHNSSLEAELALLEKRKTRGFDL